MTDQNFVIDRANILSMSTIRNDRIHLPYAVTGDVLYYAEALIAEVMPADDYPDTDDGDQRLCEDCAMILENSTVTAVLTLDVSTQKPLTGIMIGVDLPDGRRITRQIYTPAGNALAPDIITDYLADGAPGLRADIRDFYEKQHGRFLRRAILSGGAGLAGMSRECCAAVRALVNKGYQPRTILAALS